MCHLFIMSYLCRYDMVYREFMDHFDLDASIKAFRCPGGPAGSSECPGNCMVFNLHPECKAMFDRAMKEANCSDCSACEAMVEMKEELAKAKKRKRSSTESLRAT